MLVAELDPKHGSGKHGGNLSFSFDDFFHGHNETTAGRTDRAAGGERYYEALRGDWLSTKRFRPESPGVKGRDIRGILCECKGDIATNAGCGRLARHAAFDDEPSRLETCQWSLELLDLRRRSVDFQAREIGHGKQLLE